MSRRGGRSDVVDAVVGFQTEPVAPRTVAPAAFVPRDFSEYSDVVLYDSMYETGTRLGGWLVELEDLAEERGDHVEAARWQARRFEVEDERRAIAFDDREAQAAAANRWAREIYDLDPLLPAY